MQPTHLFLGGWSQGGLNTTAFLQALEGQGVKVRGAFLFHPQKSDTTYFVPLLAQTLLACEAERSYGDFKTLLSLLEGWRPIEKVRFLKPPLRNSATFAASAYGQCLARNEAYRRDVQTNLRMYYGSIDPIIRPAIGRLAADYQLAAIGTPEARQQSKVVAIPVEGSSHRLTFITAAVDAKAWMDRLR